MTGEQIRTARLAKGWSQTELARRAGVNQRVISALETGARDSAELATIRRLAAALGLELVLRPVKTAQVRA